MGNAAKWFITEDITQWIQFLDGPAAKSSSCQIKAISSGVKIDRSIESTRGVYISQTIDSNGQTVIFTGSAHLPDPFKQLRMDMKIEKQKGSQ